MSADINKIAPTETTEEDYKEFVSRCRWWLRYLGLTGWDIGYRHVADLCDDHGDPCDACCQPNIEGHIAVLSLSTRISESGQSVLSRLAFHEVCELFLADIDGLAKDRYCAEQAINVARHNIIRILENTLFTEKERGRQRAKTHTSKKEKTE